MDRILLFDLETAPSTAYIWGLYTEVNSMDFVKKEWYTLCWAAKWLDEKKVMSSSLPEHSLYKKEPENDYEVMKALRDLLDEADIVIAHNAVEFDVRKANTRFIMHKLTPPSPYKIVDTLKIARRYFSFMSNRLGDLGRFLGVGTKIDTGGFKLWKQCLAKDKKAWALMTKYCREDVCLLERVYLKLRPYIKVHPNLAVRSLLTFDMCCPKCRGKALTKRGQQVSASGLFQRYQCKTCGGWSSIKIHGWGKEERAKLLRNA